MTPDDFACLTLETAAAGLARGAFSAVDLAEAALTRIDRWEPAIHAFLAVTNEGAIAAAVEADRLGYTDEARPILRGLPLAIKDNLMTRGVRTTCASRILSDFHPPYDATAVAKLNASGMAMVGKTNLDEFAMGSTGENSAYGPTRNPWDLSRTPGGSSSGSAAATAYGGCLAALGSDTGGSIRQPAAFCGLVGMKPTYGRVSRWGLASMASSLDQIGPLTRTVRDNALLLAAIAGHDLKDSTSSNRPVPDYLADIETSPRGLKIGVLAGVGGREGMHPAATAAFEQARELCRDAGMTAVEIDLPHLDYCVAAYQVLCACEVSANLARYDGVRYGTRVEGADLWDTFARTRGAGLGREVKRRVLMGAFALSAGYYDAYYLKAARTRRLVADDVTAALERCDAILLPAAPEPPFHFGLGKIDPLKPYLTDIFTLPANLSGLPALTLPTLTRDGLPGGAQLLGRAFDEATLYRIARHTERRVSLENPPWKRSAPPGSAS